MRMSERGLVRLKNSLAGDSGEDKFIVAYVVLVGKKHGGTADKPTAQRVRAELKKKLPHYMVPAYIVPLSELPTHAVSGKLDLKALKAMRVGPGGVSGGLKRAESSTYRIAEGDAISENGEGDVVGPRSPMEARLHSVWAKVMKIPQVDVVVDR